MSRQDQYRVNVSYTDAAGKTVKIDESFDKVSGGAVDSEETKYKPGGMQPQISLGGSINVDNVTVSRLYRLDRDLDVVADLKSRVGKGTVTVTKQQLNVDGEDVGTPIVWTGKLKRISFPDMDSESSAAGLFEIEVSTAGVPSGPGSKTPA